MPFPAILRSTLLLSSLLAASSYALYQNNPQFRAFVDNTVNRITSAWDDLLASLSPEERQRQREAQRRELAIALESRQWSRGTANSEDATAVASGSRGVQDDGKARRRNLWEMAEKNAERLKKGQEEKKQTSPTLKTLPPVPIDETDDESEKPLPPIPQSSATKQSSSSTTLPLHSSNEVDPVIALLVREAETDSRLRDLMSRCSSGEASDEELGEFASRLHSLDQDALARNNVDLEYGNPWAAALPSYEAPAQSLEQTTVLHPPLPQDVTQRDHTESGYPETPNVPLIGTKQERTEIADSSRFRSTNMLQMFPELAEPQAADSVVHGSTAMDLPIDAPGAWSRDDEVSRGFEDDQYSNIMTPASPSLQSVSDAGTETASHISELVSEADEHTQSHHGDIDNDAMSLTSDTSWITGVSEANSANAWEGLDDPAETSKGNRRV